MANDVNTPHPVDGPDASPSGVLETTHPTDATVPDSATSPTTDQPEPSTKAAQDTTAPTAHESDSAPDAPSEGAQTTAPTDGAATEQTGKTDDANTPADDAGSGHAAPAGEAGGGEVPKKKPRRKKKKPAGPTPTQVIQRIGTTTASAMAYVDAPEQAWQKLSMGFLEELITDLPPVTAAALLGPEALCRHFLASAATGRYRDLFNLWDLFKAYPEQCKPILMSRTEAQERAKHKLRVATEFGLIGSAERVAEDIDRAQGLPWNWMKDILAEVGGLIAQRPIVVAAIWRKDPAWAIDLPENPDQRWLSEAAALHNHANPVPAAIDAILGQHLESLPTTPSTLGLAQQHHPDQVGALLERLDPEAEDIVATARWARDHGHDLSDKLYAHLDQVATQDRARAAAIWAHWVSGGIAPATLPPALIAPTMDGLDLGAVESWDLAAILVAQGASIDAQAIVDTAANTNRQVGEKAYEAAVCAGFNEVHLPAGLASNPNIKADARCPKCAAWTWVRPKHEARCPRSAGSLDMPDTPVSEPTGEPPAR